MSPGKGKANRRWWQRPFVWLAVIVVGALGVFVGDRIKAELGSVVPDGELLPQILDTDAIAVVDVTHLHNPSIGRWGYVVEPSADPSPLQVIDEPHSDDYGKWADANKAVDVDVSTWEITLEGRRSSPVEVVNIVPVLEEKCGPPLAGGLFKDEPQGESDKVFFEVDLANPRPTMTRDDHENDPIENYFATKKISLPKGEKNVLVIKALSKTGYCRWRYRIDYLADGRRESMTLSAPGNRPFAATGVRANYADYTWVVPPAFDQCPTWNPPPPARPKIVGADYQSFVKCVGG